MLRFRILLLGLAASLMLPVLAQPIGVRLTASQLREKGINTHTFRPVAFTSDGLTLIAQEKTPPSERIKGKLNRLWKVTYGVEGAVRAMESIEVNVPSIEALALTPDDKTAVIATLTGATFMRVPLDGGPITPIMEHKRGQPGFRGNPSYLRPITGDILTMGYFYDKDDFSGDNLLATLNAGATGQDAFTPGGDIQKLEKDIPGFYASNYTGPRSGYLAARQGTRSQLYWWDGQTPRVVDEGDKLSSFWASQDRVCYTIHRTTGSHAMFYDATRGQQVELGKGGNFAYPFLSDDGRAAVVCQLDLAQAKMDVLCAKENDSWKLKPVPSLQKVKMGAIRVSPNGRFMAFYNGDFLQFVELP
ncbi:MAG: hypothetical protein AMXMBFR33_51240 [Candidatus Xenobia bacterium]